MPVGMLEKIMISRPEMIIWEEKSENYEFKNKDIPVLTDYSGIFQIKFNKSFE